jgi:hypothetical protein
VFGLLAEMGADVTNQGVGIGSGGPLGSASGDDWHEESPRARDGTGGPLPGLGGSFRASRTV